MTYRKKILIVDDDVTLTDNFEKELKGTDAAYEVFVANNGRECMERIRIHSPDLIVLDIVMPEMNGWEVVEKIHENKEWIKIPIIFLTQKDDTLSKTMASVSVEDYLVKPVNSSELDFHIRKILKMPKE